MDHWLDAALGGLSLPHAWQGRSVIQKQGCPSRGGNSRKPVAKRWLEDSVPSFSAITDLILSIRL
jgi:hypothetical protein